MKVLPLFNEIKRDGMGSAAMTLVKAIQAQGIEVQPIHAWHEVDFAEYEAECKPLFVENDGYGVDSAHLPRMVDKVNEPCARWRCGHQFWFGQLAGVHTVL